MVVLKSLIDKFKGAFKPHPYLKITMLLFLFIVIITGFLTMFTGKVFFKNTSSSAPMGIYVMSFDQSLHYGDYVAVALPVDVPALNVKAGFPMIKKIQGFSGDTYTVTNDSIEIYGRKYKVYREKTLPEIMPGCYKVPSGSILFLNDPDISFDSRYLGPIATTYVLKKVTLIFPFEPISALLKRMYYHEDDKQSINANGNSF